MQPQSHETSAAMIKSATDKQSLKVRIGSFFQQQRILKHTALKQQACYAIGLFGMKLIGFLILPYLTKQLGVAEFARLETLLALVNGATVVVGCGLVNHLYRQAGQATTDTGRYRASAETLGSALMLGLLTWFALCLISPWSIPFLNQFWPISVLEYHLLAILISTEGVIAIPLAWIRMQERAKQFLFITLGRTLLYAVLVIGLIQLGLGVTGVLIASTLAVIAQVTVLLICHFRDTGIQISLPSLKQHVRFGAPFIVSGLAMYACQGLDIVLLSQAVSANELAAYALAVKFFLLAALFSQPFQLWWYPKRIALLQQPNGKQQAADGALAGGILATVIAMGVVTTTPMVSVYLFSPELQQLNQYLPWLALAGILKQWGALFNLGCFTTKRSEIQMIIELSTGAFCLLLFPIAISSWGIQGCLTVLIISQLLRLVAYFVISQKLLSLPYRVQPLALTTLICLPLMLAPTLLPDLNSSWITQGLFLLVVTTISAALLWHCLLGKHSLLRAHQEV